MKKVVFCCHLRGTTFFFLFCFFFFFFFFLRETKFYPFSIVFFGLNLSILSRFIKLKEEEEDKEKELLQQCYFVS
jgi:hypothetical protein